MTVVLLLFSGQMKSFKKEINAKLNISHLHFLPTDLSVVVFSSFSPTHSAVHCAPPPVIFLLDVKKIVKPFLFPIVMSGEVD